MTPLAEHLARRISLTGPMRLSDFMAEALLNPEHGYYATRDPLGAAGDFTTAPEISQMFGELVGLCIAQAWLDHGRGAFTLAELGPGRGTLMADVLRAAGRVPGFTDAADLWLVEASPTLRAEQEKRLAAHAPRWADHADALPDAPLFVIANEFFDALPIRQFRRTGDGWAEVLVGLEGDRLALGLGPPGPVAALEHRLDDTDEGTVVELRPQAEPVMQALEARIARHGGAALIIDYGNWQSRGDTLQAVAGHAPADPLAAPGTADLTAHVDFGALAAAAPGLAHSRLTPQGVFLERLGITARAQALAARLSGPALDEHVAAHRRLTHPEEMGTLFKVIGLTRPGAPMLSGLET